MRKFFAKMHLWLSIPFGIIITIVCLTGAILVFETEILELCYPSRYFVREIKGEPLSPAFLIYSAQQQLPDSVKINGIRISSDPRRTYQLVLPGKKAVCFIDPYTAEVTGIDDGQGFFMQTMRLHRWLLDSYKRDGSFSLVKAVVGYATLVFVVILVSGLAVWFPCNRKMLKNRLKIKTRAGWHRFFYDLHVSGGFYAALFLLALALTGLTWSFGWYRDAFYAVFGGTTGRTEVHVPISAGGRSMGQEGKIGRGVEKKDGDRSFSGRESRVAVKETGLSAGKRKESQKPDYIRWAEVLSVLQERYSSFNSITIQDGSATVATADYGNTRGSDRYLFDPASGQITDVQLYKDQPKSGKIRGWIYSVHTGTWGGMTTRILSCLASLLGAVFAVTGYYFRIKRKIRKMK